MTAPSDVSQKCTICLEKIVKYATCPEEEGRTLNCSHIFHNECIGEWLKYKHNCPLCRAVVEDVTTPEASPAVMTVEEVLAVPDHEFVAPSITDEELQAILQHVRQTVFRVRQFRKIDPSEDSAMGAQVRKVNSFAASFFGW